MKSNPATAMIEATNLTTLGDRLRWAIRNAKTTQAKVAEQVGCTQQNISDLCRGVTDSSKHLLAIALTLNVSPAWLALNEGSPLEYGAPSPQLVLLAQQLSSLPEESLSLLMKLLARPGATDSDVEARMPVTKNIRARRLLDDHAHRPKGK